MNAIELVHATALAVSDPNMAMAVNTIGSMLVKIERQRKHLTILDRSRLSQRRQIRELRSALANLLNEFAPRQAAGHAQLQALGAQKYVHKGVNVGDVVATPGDSFALQNAFVLLGFQDTMLVEHFERRTQEIARG